MSLVLFVIVCLVSILMEVIGRERLGMQQCRISFIWHEEDIVGAQLDVLCVVSG